ncbi:MAG TPA: hypothetical protein P5121_15085 [Caldilineaceae bacterium]|nr:hypothetical protein [Caldilineaceae bacterium]
MYEFVPLLSGVVLGLVIGQIANRTVKGLVTIVLSILIGYAASALSGELALSWLYLIFDAAQVLFASVVTAFLLTRWQQRVQA